MRIQILSDLHFEFHPDGGAAFTEKCYCADVDVLVLAGDICLSAELPCVLADFCVRYAHVVYVAGNHEPYGSSIETVRGDLARAASSCVNLHVLDNSVATIGGQRFVGTTLWFPDSPYNDLYAHALNDFQRIVGLHDQVYAENSRAVQFLRENVQRGDVVITHHLPSERSVPLRFRGDPMNRFFVCPLDDLVRDRAPAAWIHGHTHDTCNYLLHETHVVCNPFGYTGYETNPRFLTDFVIEVAGAADVVSDDPATSH